MAQMPARNFDRRLFESVEWAALPKLARANLLAAWLELTRAGAAGIPSLALLMRTLGEMFEALEPRRVMRSLNADRTAAGFPPVVEVDLVATGLAACGARYKASLMRALDALYSEDLVETLTYLARHSTAGGEKLAPMLIHDLIDSYAIELSGFTAAERRNAARLIAQAREAAAKGEGEAGVLAVLDKLGVVARNWRRVTWPVQLSLRARGLIHRPSWQMAVDLRELGIDLYNDHDLIAPMDRINTLLQECFAEALEEEDVIASDRQTILEIRGQAPPLH
jgi:hypothetical protein